MGMHDVDYVIEIHNLVNQLSDCLVDYRMSIENAEQLLKRIRKLEIQNSALIQENNEQKRKLDIIENSRIGRLGIKVYQLYKKNF